MFLEDVFLENAQNGLADLVSRTVVNAADRPYRWDPYVAKSQLQKGIRRGDVQNSLTATCFLLQVNAQGFWRRLSIIALEDIGVANVALVAQVLMLEKDCALRNRLGGTPKVGLAVVSAMCTSAKDRTTDDLLDAIASQDFDCLKADVAEQTQSELFATVASPTLGIHRRAIAA